MVNLTALKELQQLASQAASKVEMHLDNAKQLAEKPEDDRLKLGSQRRLPVSADCAADPSIQGWGEKERHRPAV